MTDAIDRRTCPGTRHGDYNAYQTYGCRCPDAGDAYYRYQKQGRLGTRIPRRIPATGSRRRIQALMRLGYTRGHIAEAIGRDERAIGHLLRENRWVYRSTADAICRIYDAWWQTPGPSSKTRRYATRRGYAPPAAWDDDTIDDPAAPHYWATRTDITYDESRVIRACRGELAYADLTRAEGADAVRRLNTSGLNDGEMARVLRSSVKVVGRRRIRMGLPSRFDGVGARGQRSA